MKNKTDASPLQGHRGGHSTWKKIAKNYELYLLLVPAFLVILLFSYIPMYGIQIAFKNFIPKMGIMGSPWVGFEQFTKFFNSFQFKNLISNTFMLSIYSILAGFPIPIFLALMLNQMKALKFKKTLQTVTYMPHFISLVVIVGMINLFFSPTTGIYGNLSKIMGFDAVNVVGSSDLFRSLYVWTDVWQHAGWDSIIYIAALSAVDPSLYEAATVDGANKWHKIWYIDLPSIVPTMVILLILRAGNIMSVGFEKVFLMQNPLNTPTSEIISTYVYKMGIEKLQYSYAAAVGLFNTLINFALLIVVNYISNKCSDTSLW